MRGARGLVAAWLALGACSVPEIIYEPPRVVVAEVMAIPDPRLDILYVIDDSPKMAVKQGVFAATLDVFFDRLRAIGTLPDLHVAVTTTDMGTDGTATFPIGTIGAGPGECVGAGNAGAFVIGNANVAGMFLSDIAAGSTRAMNYTGTLPEAVGQMISLGEGGCGFEQPLFAMMAALQNTSTGFRREDAALAIIFLTDEDDCSVRNSVFFSDSPELGERQSIRCARYGVTCAEGGTTPEEMASVGEKSECRAHPSSEYLESLDTFSSFLATAQPDPRRLMIGAVVGEPAPVIVDVNDNNLHYFVPSCSVPFAASEITAEPAIRLTEFVERGFQHSTWSSICNANLTDTQSELARLATLAVGGECVAQPILDVDRDTPGMQPDCVLEDVSGASTVGIPACGAVISRPCWRLELDVQKCPFDDHLAVVIERASPPDPASRARLRCRVP